MNINKLNTKITAVLCLTSMMLLPLTGCSGSAGTAHAVIADDSASDDVVRIGFEEDDILTELKVGRYYLETNSGINRDVFIEVLDGNLIQFFGIERKSTPDEVAIYDWNTEPVEYKLRENTPFISIYSGHSLDDDIQIGIGYIDENTLCATMQADEFDDIKDNTPDNQKEGLYPHNSLIAHFIYTSDK